MGVHRSKLWRYGLAGCLVAVAAILAFTVIRRGNYGNGREQRIVSDTVYDVYVYGLIRASDSMSTVTVQMKELPGEFNATFPAATNQLFEYHHEIITSHRNLYYTVPSVVTVTTGDKEKTTETIARLIGRSAYLVGPVSVTADGADPLEEH